MNICGQDVGLRYLNLPWVLGNNLGSTVKDYPAESSYKPYSCLYHASFLISFQHNLRLPHSSDHLVLEECGDDQFI